MLEELAERFALPAEMLGLPKVIITGESRVWIENHRGLLEYSEDIIRISGGKLQIAVRGDGLRLLAMDSELLVISGQIFGVDME